MKRKFNFIDIIAIFLTIIGGLNWGFIGFLNFDFISQIFGDLNVVTRIIYMIIGLSSLWLIFSFYKFRRSNMQ